MIRLLATLALFVALAAPRPALAWEWLRSENDHVAEGNDLMASGDHAGALAEYDLAARELPSEPGVHLDRGLALLAMGEYGRAREALQLATEPPASAEIRAMAHYDIGLSYYLEGDAASRGGAAAAAPAPSPGGGPLGALGGILGGGGAPPPAVSAPPAEPDHARARDLFREAADAVRDSLRQVPGNRDAGWNLELALRRITEEEEAEREEEERESEENSESEESEESSEDGSEGEDGEPSEEGSEGEESEESSEGESGEEDQPGEPGEEESEGGEGEEESDAPSEEGDGADESEESGAEEEGDSSSTGGGEEAPSEPDEGEGSETEAGGTTEDSLPPDMERVLDALETSEENLSAARARARGSAERRRVERDW
jgi:tetratricopeptide (TPR) repeat protein